MEEQIKLLKEEYLSIEPDASTEDGLSDLWERIDKTPTVPFSRYIILAIVILLLSGGFFGAVQASQPGSPLYPIRVATNQIISTVVKNIDLIPKEEPKQDPKPEENSLPFKENGTNSRGNAESDAHPPDNPGSSISEEARQNRANEDVQGVNTEDTGEKKKGPPFEIQTPNENSGENSNGNGGNSEPYRQDEDNKGLEKANEKSSNNPGKPN